LQMLSILPACVILLIGNSSHDTSLCHVAYESFWEANGKDFNI